MSNGCTRDGVSSRRNGRDLNREQQYGDIPLFLIYSPAIAAMSAGEGTRLSKR